MPPSIAINARVAGRPRISGVERCAHELIPRLTQIAPDTYFPVAPPAGLSHRAGHIWEQFVLPVSVMRRRAQLLFSPANLAPLGWPRNVVIIHDVAPLRCPDWYSSAYVAWQRFLLPRLVKIAVHIVTVSEFSRDEIIQVLGVRASKVTAIPEGVNSQFSPESDCQAVAVALGLNRPYVLTVASRSTRKNLAGLQLAAKNLAGRGIELICAGDNRPQFKQELTLSGIRTLGYVPDNLLPGLYAGAQAFVLPSLYEGFGLTCLEAMACGTPVIAADRAALTEVCGDAALFVDPSDQSMIAETINTVIADQQLQRELRAKGLERAKLYTWEKSATAIHETLTKLL